MSNDNHFPTGQTLSTHPAIHPGIRYISDLQAGCHYLCKSSAAMLAPELRYFDLKPRQPLTLDQITALDQALRDMSLQAIIDPLPFSQLVV